MDFISFLFLLGDKISKLFCSATRTGTLVSLSLLKGTPDISAELVSRNGAYVANNVRVWLRAFRGLEPTASNGRSTGMSFSSVCSVATRRPLLQAHRYRVCCRDFGLGSHRALRRHRRNRIERYSMPMMGVNTCPGGAMIDIMNAIWTFQAGRGIAVELKRAELCEERMGSFYVERLLYFRDLDVL